MPSPASCRLSMGKMRVIIHSFGPMGNLWDLMIIMRMELYVSELRDHTHIEIERGGGGGRGGKKEGRGKRPKKQSGKL